MIFPARARWLAPVTATILCFGTAWADAPGLSTGDELAAISAAQRNVIKREDNGQSTRSGVPIPWQGPGARGEIIFQPIVSRPTDQICDQDCAQPCRHFQMSVEQSDATRRYGGMVCAEGDLQGAWRLAGALDPLSVTPHATAPVLAAEPASPDLTDAAAAASDPDVVRRVERGLRELAYYNGPVDGLSSPALLSAVQQFADDARVPTSTSWADLAGDMESARQRSEAVRNKTCGDVTGAVVVCGARVP